MEGCDRSHRRLTSTLARDTDALAFVDSAHWPPSRQQGRSWIGHEPVARPAPAGLPQTDAYISPTSHRLSQLAVAAGQRSPWRRRDSSASVIEDSYDREVRAHANSRDSRMTQETGTEMCADRGISIALNRISARC